MQKKTPLGSVTMLYYTRLPKKYYHFHSCLFNMDYDNYHQKSLESRQIDSVIVVQVFITIL